MSKFRLKQQADDDPAAIIKYCTALRWDPDRLMSSLSSIGLSHKETYLERPNEVLISVLAEFLTVTGSSIFVATGANGEGKSGLKEFCMRVFIDDYRFLSFSIDNPGPYTAIQLLKTIAMNLSDAPVPRSKEKLMAEIERELIEYRKRGKTILIWIDEGQKLDIHKIALLRALADIKTPDGLLTCKVMILGTPDLNKHIENWLASEPEEAGAFDDRTACYKVSLRPWTKEDVVLWWGLLTQFIGTGKRPICPFTHGLADLIATMSEGKPRSIVQLTQIALNYQAREHAKHADRLQIDVEEFAGYLKNRLRRSQ